MMDKSTRHGAAVIRTIIEASPPVPTPTEGSTDCPDRQSPSDQTVQMASGPASPKQVLNAVAETLDLFHGPDGTGYADIDISGHRETLAIKSTGFGRWLSRQCYMLSGGVPGADVLNSALALLDAKAQFDGSERAVCVRVGEHDGRLYLDLCDDKWRAVEIDAGGWRVVDRPPVRFRRSAGMRQLPTPMSGGSIDLLRPFLNVGSDTDFVLAVTWLLACLRNRGPYPVLVLAGEQGSAKSTFASMLRGLVDPNTAPLRALPGDDRDLFIAASNGHVLAFDNVSGLRGWTSDALCRLATGGGFATRRLYSDDEEVLINATRPVILNGIEDIVARPDLADRAIFLTLQPIPDTLRRPEAELWAAFNARIPQILGALLDAVVKGLAMLPKTRLDTLPRMADFATWATACETACWPAGTFLQAYRANADSAVTGIIEAEPVASAILRLMASQAAWDGTCTELLHALTDLTEERTVRSRDWPANARALSGRARRAAPALRRLGIELVFDFPGGRAGKERMVSIRTVAVGATTHPSAPSAPSAVVTSAENSDTMSGNAPA